MPDPITPPAANPANPTPPAADPKNPPAPAPQTFDPEKDLTPEQWDVIYKSGRFRQLNEKAKKATELEKAQKDAEEAKLKEQGEYQKLADQRQQELTQMQTAVINAEIKAVAATLGAVNPTIVASAIKRDGIKFENGETTGVNEAIEALKQSDPYLFNNTNNQPPRVGNPTNPSSNPTGFKFTMSQVRDPEFYQKNRDEILKAMSSGQVDKNA